MREFILKHDKKIHRILEILPGFTSWNLILFPVWASFIWPTAVAYFMLMFNVFWFYKSIVFAFTTVLSHLRIKASEKLDWVKEAQGFSEWTRVNHLIIVAAAREPIDILRRTFKAIAAQDLPHAQIHVILALEAIETEAERQDKEDKLRKEFGKSLPNFYVTVHKLTPDETKGKHANQRFAAMWAYDELIKNGKLDIEYLTITSCDADHVYHPKYFSYLTYKFLDEPHRYRRFWQSAILFYNNFWRIPALSRVANTFGSLWNMALLARKERMINQQNYSLSFKLLHEIGYWDPQVIPEDYHIFFKAYFATRGEVEVEPIYLPLYADAAESTNFLKTVKNQYEQFKRWAWGVSDDPYVIKNYFLTPGVPFIDKTIRVLRLMEDHFLWPVNWFLITLGVNIPSIFNPAFSRTSLGFNLPRMSSVILTICLGSLLVVLIVDARQRPPRPKEISRWRVILIPFEFILMPIAGFIFGALPGLDAHTRLMLGRYLEYRVTEKVTGN
jgi:cellulose synthase/poly-beta-1,6-N-acetylglucosamine synthase-like glycosyltransferase